MSSYHHKSSRDRIYRFMNLDETYLHLVEIHAIITKSHTGSLRVMYDDYDLDYTYGNDSAYDLDEYSAFDVLDLDEDYARDGQDYEALAYRHYA